MLVLASQSPIRQRLMLDAGLKFVARPACINERDLDPSKGTTADDQARLLARAKALDVAKSCPDDLVIGCDQILSCDKTILHKPTSMDAARTRLRHLSGRTHSLHTAVTLCHNETILWEYGTVAHLTMHTLSDMEIDALLAVEGVAALQSVGAYRLEGPAIRLFKTIEGDYFAILGLPLLPLLAALRQHAPHSLDF